MPGVHNRFEKDWCSAVAPHQPLNRDEAREMTVSLKTHKILWARSGGKCAICKNDLVIDPTDLNDDPSIVGDEAHIIARSESFTRGDYDSLSPEKRDHY